MEENILSQRQAMKVLLLEKVHPSAKERFEAQGFLVSEISRSLSKEELKDEIKDVHILGIRSKTKITSEHIASAENLLVIGCFGVGTNQVAIEAATGGGVPVFNAPFSSTRSVAELAIGNMIVLARKAADRSAKMHRGVWEKGATNCYEVRDKTIGIVGYGHIGQQVGLLAEAVGLRVVFYDQLRKLPLGRAKPVDSFEGLLTQSDFVSLHVPADKSGKPVMGHEQLAKMKQGSYLLNLGRGSLIDLSALREMLLSGHLSGAAIDVYPKEPASNNEKFACELTGVENVILTPHIGGSTEEAQCNIGIEVASSITDFINGGITIGAVNFPEVSLFPYPDSHRILSIHQNVPGVLSAVNSIVSKIGANIESQYLVTYKDIGYLTMDVNKEVSSEVMRQISDLDANIKTRILY